MIRSSSRLLLVRPVATATAVRATCRCSSAIGMSHYLSRRPRHQETATWSSTKSVIEHQQQQRELRDGRGIATSGTFQSSCSASSTFSLRIVSSSLPKLLFADDTKCSRESQAPIHTNSGPPTHARRHCFERDAASNQQPSVRVQARSCRDRSHSSCTARKLNQNVCYMNTSLANVVQSPCVSMHSYDVYRRPHQQGDKRWRRGAHRTVWGEPTINTTRAQEFPGT
jgi:hypothetical protein